MRRRDFIALVSGSAAAIPITARAEQPKMPTVGVLVRDAGFVTATLSSTHREPRLAARHAAATASCHCAVASVRKIRSVDREMRWR